MLDHGTKETIERVVGHEEILELVETHDRQAAVGSVKRQGYVKQLEQRRASLVSCRAGRARTKWSPP